MLLSCFTTSLGFVGFVHSNTNQLVWFTSCFFFFFFFLFFFVFLFCFFFFSVNIQNVVTISFRHHRNAATSWRCGSSDVEMTLSVSMYEPNILKPYSLGYDIYYRCWIYSRIQKTTTYRCWSYSRILKAMTYYRCWSYSRDLYYICWSYSQIQQATTYTIGAEAVVGFRRQQIILRVLKLYPANMYIWDPYGQNLGICPIWVLHGPHIGFFAHIRPI